MRKRLFTSFLVVVMVLSVASSAMAYKKSETFSTADENIYALWGDFETTEQFNQASTIQDNTKTSIDDRSILTHISGGAAGSKKAIEVNVVKPDAKDYLSFPFGATAGEKYIISFYLKHNSKDAKNVNIDFQHRKQENIATLPLNGNPNEWTKYEYTWVCDGIKHRTYLGAATDIYFYLDGEESYTFWFDRLSVIPVGYKKADYSRVNFHYDYEASEEESKEIKNDDFCDIEYHWARPVIKSLSNAGIVNGKGDGTYAPDADVTRAEFIKMAYATINSDITPYDSRFSDVSKDKWYADVLASADVAGIVAEELKSDGKIAPDAPITREEAASVAEKAADLRGGKKSINHNFTDENEISDWAKHSVKNAAGYGIISGYDDGSFKPKKSITRAEAAQMILNLIEITDRMNIYVDTETGNNKNDGTFAKPLKTVEAARDMAKTFASKMQNDITIYIRGEQYFENTFTLNEKHSGQNGFDIIYTSWDADKAVFTMAKTYTGFELHDAEKNIYKTFVGKGIHSRQAFFNDVRGVRSRTVGYLENCDFVYKTHWLCDDMSLLDIAYPKEVDAVFHMLWTNPRYMVDSFTEEDGRVKMTVQMSMDDDLSHVLVRYDQDTNTRRQTPSWLENAYEFLDEKGEWYLNRHDGYMYYIPRDGEDINTLECKIPLGEQLLMAQGSNYDNPLHNVTFDNILFEGTTWLEIDRMGGFAPLQNDCLPNNQEEGFGTSMTAAVHFEKCNNITISNNVFRQLAHSGLKVVDGAKYVEIAGNEFYDISSTAMTIDDVADGGYPTGRSRESYVEYIDINNNYIHHISKDYEGGAAVTFLWPRHTTFHHNEIAYSPYSGLHVGWGWNAYEVTGSILYDFEVSKNYIHDIMVQRVNDGSAFYSVGASSFELDTTPYAKNNGANKNRILNNYFANGWTCDLVYPDQESSSWYVANNVADKGPHVLFASYNYDRAKGNPTKFYWAHLHATTDKWITFENNYATHGYPSDVGVNGLMDMQESQIETTKIVADRNWPAEAQAIINEAGIEPRYRDNFNLDVPNVFISNNSWQTIRKDVPADSGLMIIDNKNEKHPLSDYDIDFWCDTPGAVTMDENGFVTAHESGVFECEAWVTLNGISMHQHFMFEVLGDIVNVAFNQDKINMLADYTADLTVLGFTEVGRGENISGLVGLEVSVKSMDESVAVFSYDEIGKSYTVTGVARGKTSLVGTIKYFGKTYNVDIPVAVITHGNEEAEDLPYAEVDFTTGWLDNNAGATDDGGMKVAGLPSNHTKVISNQLVAFDMVIEDGSGWPSIAFCDTDVMSDYSSEDCYMIGFKPDFIEFQRWNRGERTMIYGEESFNPVGGPGINNTGANKIFEYKKRYSIIMGALDTEEGTRIILTINGKNVLDYLDTTDKAIKSHGFFVSYNPAPGGTTFYPFTNIQSK